jgi:dephospho-CoA kinase
MPSKPVPLVGVTGGIGSGKSAVCSCFEKLGRVVLSADRIARDLTESDPGVRRALSEKFGAGIYGPDGALLRGELARIVFARPAKLRMLNDIVHPLVFASLNDALAGLPEDAGRPYAVVEAALVFESGMDRQLDATVVVKAPVEVRIERVLRRDRITREDVLSRMRAQMSQEETSKRGDFIIENNGPELDLMEKVGFIDRVLALLFQ